MQEIFNQALALHQQGKLAQAENIYRQILDKAPGQPVICAQLSLLLQQAGKLPEAFSFAKKAIEALPEEHEVALQGAGLAVQLGHNQQAETWLKQALQLKPKHEKALEQLAGVLIGNHKEKDALGVCKSLIKVSPKNANAYNLKGLALSRLGEGEKGYSCFQKSLKLNPGQIAVIRNLILYGKGRKEPLLESIIPQLEKSFSQQTQAPAVQMNVAYILSMYYERSKKTDKSFMYLKMGNDIARKGVNYQHSQTENDFKAILNAFDEGFLNEVKGAQLSDDSPIFILGMPRSGTTLIEQIISSHSQVEAEGEILDLRESFRTHGEILNSDISADDKASACVAVMTAYLDKLRARQKATYFTDKMPYNFMFVGLILTVMPNAKVIHCTRDPLETCFSIYKQNFSGSPAYTNDLTELGQYYIAYKDMMKHWQNLFGDRIYEANYEAMVDNSEHQINNLLAFCHLEPEGGCFEFHKNKRAVRTASVAQVRQPIYKDAKRASAPYEKYLAPLIEVLQNVD
ncbi:MULTISPECIES: sulfotransferase [unclassified Oleiphilus]|jgi:tetratricopeptide (TPR) repeat protein|uniref:tetratricopeptide repeat-containing sulfotransferase family protein n=3 Tax=Oleiphilus TaxID=141450 RepID=UPI0007C2CA69|nr:MULTISPECIES: sulfotransferase [unclassified Oleiphilus]KZY47946.1 hypothetical protein A3732_24695 [Oleiphilus sp. HI0050]KZY76373.1 hypothetical protein A3740_00195 [Oleiphilus sp. HI0068]KZY81195.1 hypothetical protein A3741_17625 [Oleiphilus sp. HI0069]KZY88677.1 hypothetical protein A3743_10970 [Oleiphilus sp. HI0072]KZZ19365.1 hypothetical protein A3749_20930 [Oleiphilus sp. HI0078]